MIKKLAITIFALSFPFISLAETKGTTYTVGFAEHSPIKSIPLENASLKIKVFYNRNPKGIMTVKLDENHSFTLEKFKDSKAIVLEVIALIDEKKYNTKCHDYNVSGTDIQLTCHELRKS